MDDITPGLLKKIQEDFQKDFDASATISGIYKKVREGTATYKEANEFAIETGEILARAFRNNLSSDILPDGRMYYNIAQRIIPSTLANNFELISDIAIQVQEKLNKDVRIGIKAIKPALNEDKVQGLVDIVSGKEHYDDIAYMLDEPVVNFSQAIVDDTVRANADFQYKAGLSPKIVRTATGKCCDWCAKLVGIYDYEKVKNTGNDVFRRHRFCRCMVEYDPGDGKVQDVHTRKWSNKDDIEQRMKNSKAYEERAKSKKKEVQESRKEIGLKDSMSEKEKRIENSKKVTSKDLDGMSLKDLQKFAVETATEYYKSGLSGISFGDVDVKKAAETLARSGSRASLKKDILSMRKKLSQNVEKNAGNDTIKLSNEEVRRQYVLKASKIKDSIDSTLPIEQQARQAFEARNKIRTDARNSMADETTRKKLDKDNPNPTFEQLITSKMKRKNMTRDEAIFDIYETATKTNKSINRELGIGGE